MSDIIEFWENRNAYRNMSPSELKYKVIAIYTEDFLANYSNWMDSLKGINEMALEGTKNLFVNAEQWWEDISFDFFCDNVLASIKTIIDNTKTIEAKDIVGITEKMINDHICALIDKAPKHVAETPDAIQDTQPLEPVKTFDEIIKKSITRVKFI